MFKTVTGTSQPVGSQRGSVHCPDGEQATGFFRCITHIIRRTNNLITKTKSGYIKMVIRPVITYAAETKPDRIGTIQIMKTVQIKTL